MKNKINFVFFGTGDFATKILDSLYKNDFKPSLIITTPDKPMGRKMLLSPTPVKNWAQKNNKVVIQPKNLLDIRQMIATYFDLFIVADYGKIIPIHVFNIPRYGTLNVHPSLLPKFRGPSPIQSFILSGEKETGVTIILMNEQVDEGPIIAKSEIRSTKSETYRELEEKLAELGAELLVKTVPAWVEGKIKPMEQDDSQAILTKKIKKEDGLINLEENPEMIARKIRAFTPWPNAYFFISSPTSLTRSGRLLRIIITKAEVKNNQLIIKNIIPEGKKEMDFRDFLRGNKISGFEKYLG